jgi:peptidyl-tRNA hydrolase
MCSGKIASQAGHAFLDALLNASQNDSHIAEQYRQNSHGIKICLSAENLHRVLAARDWCLQRSIPHALITDLGYTQFEGQSTITALGFGPARKRDVYELTRKFSLMRDSTPTVNKQNTK